jgi:hypothetical protein
MGPEKHADALPSGAQVVLSEDIYGYEAGSRGVVTRSNAGTAWVRFESTGHTVALLPQILLVER